MWKAPLVLRCASASAALAATPLAAHAQSTASAQSTLIDPSIRASGMGRASGAVFWGFETNDWANPALLAYREGIGYEFGRTQLIPGLAEDVYFTTNRFFLGAWGVQFAFSGEPIDGFGGVRLDYGESVAVGDDEVVLGTFTSYEDLDGWGVGVSLGTVTENALGQLTGHDIPVSAFADVALGYAHKDVYVNLAPAWATEDGRSGEADASNEDIGVLVRVSPLAVGGTLLADVDHGSSRTTGVRIELDLAFALSRQSRNDEFLRFAASGLSGGMGRLDRTSGSVRFAIGLPASWQRSLERSGRGWLARAIDPILELGYVQDRIDPSVPQENGPRLEGRHIDGYGGELTLANVISARWGRIDDPEGTIVDNTWGFGIRVPISNLASLHYDHASVPQSEFLDDRVSRNGFMVRVDMEQVMQRLRATSRAS